MQLIKKNYFMTLLNELFFFIAYKISKLYTYLMETLSKEKSKTISRKFNTEYRKKLVSRMEKILVKNKSDSLEIYNIINEDIGTNFSTNRNGIFINMNILSDKCIGLITSFIDDKYNSSVTMSECEKPHYNVYKLDDIEYIPEIGQKLSNMEKHIIKRIRNKKD